MNSLVFTLSRRALSPREVNQIVGQVRASNARFDMRRKPINNATLEDARAESRKLYKAYLRAVPEIMENYKVTEISERNIYKFIRSEWEKTSHVTDPRVIGVGEVGLGFGVSS